MELLKYANLSVLRIKKKAWMSEECYHTTLAFTDSSADCNPKKSSLPPYKSETLNLGVNASQEANGPNNGHHNAIA